MKDNDEDFSEKVNEDDSGYFYTINHYIKDVDSIDLQMALEEISSVDWRDEKEMEEFDEETSILVYHILHTYWKKGKKTFSDTELSDDMNKLIIGHVLENMVKDGELEPLIDETGEVYYSVPEEK